MGDLGRNVSRARDLLGNPGARARSWLADGILRKLLGNSGWLAGGQAMAAALGLLGLILKTHSLGATSFGLLTVLLAYGGIVGTFCSFQSWAAFIKFAAGTAKERPAEFMGYVKLSLLLDVVGATAGGALGFFGAFAFAHWRGWDPSTTWMAALAGASVLFNLTGTPMGILRLLDKFKWVPVQQTATAALSLAGSAVVFFVAPGVAGFLAVSLGASILGNILLIGMAFKAMREHGLLAYASAPLPPRRPFMRFAGWTYLSSTLDIPFKQLDVVIASAVISLEAAGIFKILKQITQIFGMLADPIYQSSYPQFATLVRERQAGKAGRYAVKIGLLIAGVLGPISVLGAITAPWWLGLVFGHGFGKAWMPLSVFLVLKSVTVSTVAIGPLFIAMGHVRYNAWILFFGNTFYLLVAWFGGRAFGLWGLIAAWFLQVFVVVGSKAWVLAGHQRSRGGKG